MKSGSIPTGKEVKGDELKDRSQSKGHLAAAAEAGRTPGLALKFRGYEHDDILTQTLKTDTNGVAELSFTPEREGYYRVAWTSEDAIAKKKFKSANPIHAPKRPSGSPTATTTELGYRHGGVEIIADKDTFRVGQRAPVMLVAPTNDRYVLFSVEGEDLYSYQLVHLDGTVKLVELPIEEKHVPNIFLSAAARERPADFHGHQTSRRAADEEFPDRGREARPRAIPAARGRHVHHDDARTTRANPCRRKWRSASWTNRCFTSRAITPAIRGNFISARNAAANPDAEHDEPKELREAGRMGERTVD